MNLYQSWRRVYVQFDWDAFHGIRFAIGRWPKESPFPDDEYAADPEPSPDNLEWHKALNEMGRDVGMAVDKAVLDNAFIRAERAPHPFQDAEALQGHITTPAGAQSGWSQAIKEAHEDSPQAMNWVDQGRDGS